MNGYNRTMFDIFADAKGIRVADEDRERDARLAYYLRYGRSGPPSGATSVMLDKPAPREDIFRHRGVIVDV